ncbi:MAG: manganese efflux pump [Clostridiaceae bacterium]|jgi:putative Mn2+ efflux pump MntP|nr:manganese efflux pump [Clostridiaceae bacterium]
MDIFELLLIAVGLSMDAFAVAICKGLSTRKLKLSNMALTGLFFGGFQALMPLAGYLLCTQFRNYIDTIGHWIAFALLCIIGINMIRESRNEHCENVGDAFNVKSLTVLAVATSIDALAVGVSFAFLQVDIVPAVALIGVITFVLSAAGVRIGNIFGTKFKSKAEFVGGIILIGIGLKILLEKLLG